MKSASFNFEPDLALSFQGLTLLVGSNNPRLVREIERELSFLTTTGTGGSEVLRYFFHDRTLPVRDDFSPPPVEPKDQMQLSERITGFFPLDKPGAWVIADRGYRWDEAVIASINILSNLATLALGRSRGTFTFHGAALVRNDSALLLPGMTGSGKTTVSFAATLSGWTCLTDEWTILLPGPPFKLMGFPRGFRVYGEIVKRYPQIFRKERLAGKYAAFEDRGFLILQEIRDRTPFDRSYPIAKIVILDHQAGTDQPVLTPAGTGEATYELLTSLFGASRKEEGISATEYNRQGFSIVRSLIEYVPVFRLTCNIFRHLPEIPSLLDTLVPGP
ncbi:MAG: hypothetical protein GXP58_01475 [Deltaproteobacteria bacterium]|nr:hypothetical protein [Deltaproteobacteria bacterium]